MSTVLGVILAAAGVAIDQIIKYIVLDRLAPVGSVQVIPGLLDFTYVENRGAAFGILQNRIWFFIVLTVLISAAVIFLWFRYRHHTVWSRLGAVLILSGGIGNLIDRLVLGFVVDYIHVSFFPPVFNFADCCVVIGTVLVMVHVLFFSERRDAE